MKNLLEFVKQRNAFNKMFGSKPLDLTVAADRQRVAEIIDSALSPENLTCDGELPRSVVQLKMRNLTRCAEELLSIDPSVTFYEYN